MYKSRTVINSPIMCNNSKRVNVHINAVIFPDFMSV